MPQATLRSRFGTSEDRNPTFAELITEAQLLAAGTAKTARAKLKGLYGGGLSSPFTIEGHSSPLTPAERDKRIAELRAESGLSVESNTYYAPAAPDALHADFEPMWLRDP